jgi:IclR family transcriptional regulator, acetate operon repressor
VRAQGHAIALEELEPGFVAAAAPVRDASGAVVAALSVGGPKARLSSAALASCARRVTAAAQRVSARLGDVGSRPARTAASGRKSR